MLRQADSTTAGEPVSAFASASTPALAAMRRHVEQAVQIQTVRQVLARAALQAVYQPIVRLQTGVVMGHEALIRGPLESPLQRRIKVAAQHDDRCGQVACEHCDGNEGEYEVDMSGQRGLSKSV